MCILTFIKYRLMNSNILELKEYLSQKGLKQTEIAKKYGISFFFFF